MAEMESEFQSKFNEQYSLVSRKMMRALSENSRMRLTKLAKQFNISRTAARKRLLKLEQEFGIKYTLELNEEKIGIVNPHIIMVKFGKKPDPKYLAGVFARSYIPQVAATVKGTYDLLIYANAPTNAEYIHWDKSMQILLADYDVLWQPSDVGHKQLGFYPVRNELLDRLDVPQEHKLLIRALNSNARASFQDISKQTGMHFNTVAYNFKKLLKLGYIKRFTLTTDKPENVIIMTHFSRFIASKTFEDDSKRNRAMWKADDDYPLISRYLLINQLVGSYDFFAAGVFDNIDVAYHGDLARFKQHMRPERPKIVYGTVEKVLLGRLPIRSVDTKKEYNTLVWSPEFDNGVNLTSQSKAPR